MKMGCRIKWFYKDISLSRTKFSNHLCASSLLIALVATAANAQEGAVLRSESGEWVCTSRDSDGISPFAFAIEQDTFEVDINIIKEVLNNY